jgi:hypothetical protein
MRRYSNQGDLTDLLRRCLAIPGKPGVVRSRPEAPRRLADRLTDADRAHIARSHAQGEATLKELSNRYGLCINSVWKVIRMSSSSAG